MIQDPESRFTGLPPLVSYVDGSAWKVERDISYRISTGKLAGQVSTVRLGFVTDWASIPRACWWILPPAGSTGSPYGIAALWHDWLYRLHRVNGLRVTREQADNLMFEIMVYTGCGWLCSHVIWSAVRAFGGPAWKTEAGMDTPPDVPKFA